MGVIGLPGYGGVEELMGINGGNGVVVMNKLGAVTRVAKSC